MREIKFRAWDKKNKCWCSLEPFNIIGEYTIFNCLNQYIEMDFINRINDIEIVQFTGLKDKNGKEIYEGDIVHDNQDYSPETIGIVRYDKGEFYLDGRDNSDNNYWILKERLFMVYNMIEVIGNIYENQELIKWEKLNSGHGIS